MDERIRTLASSYSRAGIQINALGRNLFLPSV